MTTRPVIYTQLYNYIHIFERTQYKLKNEQVVIQLVVDHIYDTYICLRLL